MALCVSACAHLEKSSEDVPEGTPTGPLGTPGLGEGRVGKLFDCFDTLRRKSPESLYWVSPLKGAEGYYLTTQFQHLPVRKYSGHELIIFNKELSSYYYMPGAEPDATGFVPPGRYRVDAELPEPGRTVSLLLDKRYPGAFVLVGEGAEQEGTVHRVFPRKLLDWIINEELHELAHYGLNFQLQALRSGLPREQVASVMADGTVASSCRNISSRLDTALGLLEDALASPGTTGTR